MSSSIPPSIQKQVKPFLSRAKELEKANPPISYFCKLYCAQLILDQGLHQNSTEVAQFVDELLDNIETLKAEASPVLQELIDDESKGLDYVKSFAFKVLENARKQVENHTSTKKTAIEFVASTNFLGLIKLWDPQDPAFVADVAQRIKFAKFHAARILKGIKNGEDINEYEIPQEKSSEIQPEHETVQEEVHELVQEDNSDAVSVHKSDDVHIIDVDIDEKLKGVKSVIDEPIESLSKVATPYLGNVSVTPPLSGENSIVERPSPLNLATSSPRLSSERPSPIKIEDQRSLGREYSKDEITMMMEETETYSKAQKHAKYAISALNYEDRATAIEELRKALYLLEN